MFMDSVGTSPRHHMDVSDVYPISHPIRCRRSSINNLFCVANLLVSHLYGTFCVRAQTISHQRKQPDTPEHTLIDDAQYGNMPFLSISSYISNWESWPGVTAQTYCSGNEEKILFDGVDCINGCRQPAPDIVDDLGGENEQINLVDFGFVMNSLEKHNCPCRSLLLILLLIIPLHSMDGIHQNRSKFNSTGMNGTSADGMWKTVTKYALVNCESFHFQFSVGQIHFIYIYTNTDTTNMTSNRPFFFMFSIRN